MTDQRTLTPPGTPSGTAPGAETATGESAPHAGQPTPARYAVPFLSGHSGRPDAAGPGALAQGAELVHMAGATGFAGGVYRREDSIKRSRFIVSVAHAPDTATARAFIEAVRGEFADATHNCWAFAAGPPGDTARIGCSDDGEPHGTAGRPMLQQLLHGGVGEVAAVVTRYFGGVKLGTGGLVRAYAAMARLGLDGLPLRQRIVPAHVSVVLAHGRAGALRRLLPAYEAAILSEVHGADVECIVGLPVEHAAAFMAAVIDMAAGEALVDVLPPAEG